MMANRNADRIPVSEAPVWAHVMRPLAPLFYLDLNHFIFLARANADDPTAPHGYHELLAATRAATGQGRVQVILSGPHLFEMSDIKDPRQRSNIADVMEELSGFQYILGRPEITRLEIEAGISAVLDDDREPGHLPLIGPSFGRAFGWRGGVVVRDREDNDQSPRLRRELGDDAYSR